MQPTWVANHQCHTTCLTLATLVHPNILLFCMVVHRGHGFSSWAKWLQSIVCTMQPAWVANQQCHTTCFTLATLVQSNILLFCMVVHRGNGSSSWAKWLQSTVCTMQPTWVANQQCHTTWLTVATLVQPNILLFCMVVRKGNGSSTGQTDYKAQCAQCNQLELPTSSVTQHGWRLQQ